MVRSFCDASCRKLTSNCHLVRWEERTYYKPEPVVRGKGSNLDYSMPNSFSFRQNNDEIKKGWKLKIRRSVKEKFAKK